MSEGPSRPRRSLVLPSLAIGCLLAGVVIGYEVRDQLSGDEGRFTFSELRDDGYRFISPLLECESARDDVHNRVLRPFRAKLEADLHALGPPAAAQSASIYFRELDDGTWFSINEAARYSPASMRKVPMLMAILKQAERTPELLSRAVPATLQQDHEARQNFKPAQPLVSGQSYTVGELLSRMIVGSDNNAFMLLSRVVDPEELGRVYGLLAMRLPSAADGEEPPYAVLTYSSFFRILYNATYLPKDLSEAALGQLASAEFRAGLVAGVPAAVAVAHKFAERSDVASGGKQLHDCGIVYYPRHPYLLCVMTRGSSFDELAGAIAWISRRVYEEVDAQHRTEH